MTLKMIRFSTILVKKKDFKEIKEKIGRVSKLCLFFSMSIIFYQRCTTVPQGILAFGFCIDNLRNGFAYSLQLHDNFVSWLCFPGNFYYSCQDGFHLSFLRGGFLSNKLIFLIDLKKTFILTGRDGNCPIMIEALLA